MSRPRREALITGLLVTLVLLVMFIALVTLLWLERRFEEAMTAEINRTAEVFLQANVLGEPSGAEGVRFLGRLYPLIDANRRGFIKDIWVTKRLASGREHLLHPLTTWYTDPDWPQRIADWERRDLVSAGGEVLGHLYFDIDRTWIDRTALAARSIGALMIVAMVLLISRLWGTSRRLEATTGALKERQRELIHLERLALAGQLSANVLHDLKKPVLNIRHGLTDLHEALREFNGPSRAIEELVDQADLFKTILRETSLERFVQARDTDREFVDIGETLRQAANLVQYERGDVELIWQLTEPLPAVHGSRHQLIQVFSNLILNAYQAMEGHGQLTLRSLEVSGGVRVEIADTGPGLAPSVLERLFEPFVTTKSAEVGTGLGLMICRMIVEQHGGRIDVDEAPISGACFTVILPVDQRR